MPDQTLQILIETITKGDGAKTTLQDLRRLVQETNAGSKEAAAALDHWRATYGKLRNEMAAGVPAGNTGRGLATSPNLPYSGPLPPVIPQAEQAAGLFEGRTARAAIGGAASRLTGVAGLAPALLAGGATGLAIAGIDTAVTVVQRLIDKLDRLSQSWQRAQHDLRLIERGYETVAQRVDTVDSKQTQLAQHNRLVAESWSQIHRQINNVQSAVGQMLAVQERELEFQEKLAAMEDFREQQRIRFNTRLNPIAQLQQEEALTERIAARRLEYERGVEQARLRALQLQQTAAAAQEEADQKKLSAINKILPAAQQSADTVKDEAETTIAAAKARGARLEQERLFVEQLASGRITPLAGYKGYQEAREGIRPTEGFTVLDALVFANQGQVRAGVAGFDVQAAAQKRLAEIDSIQNELAAEKQSARDATRGSGSMVELLEKRQKRQEDYVEEQQRIREQAARDERNLREVIDVEERSRGGMLDRQREGLQIQRDTGILNSSQAPPLGPLTSDASATLKSIDEKLGTLITQWS